LLLSSGRWLYSPPKSLPCGAKINRGNRHDECCRTVCPDKPDAEIEICHRTNKRKNRRPEFEPPKEDGYEQG
jgi:hypothetical protein